MTTIDTASHEINKAKRAKIIAKVQALLTKTTANGCSEAEALSAAELATRLMEEYDLTFTDLETEIRAESFDAHGRPFWKKGASGRRRTFHEVNRCIQTIAEYWDCQVWYSGIDMVFFGEKSDTDNAHAMADMIRLAMDQQWNRYLNGPVRDRSFNGRTLRASFMVGMPRRIVERLEAMKAARTAADIQRRGSTALVVVKNQIVTEKFAEYCRQQDLKLRTSTSSISVGSSDAFDAGMAAGSSIDLGGDKVGTSIAGLIGN
jgi:hypothetical protein